MINLHAVSSFHRNRRSQYFPILLATVLILSAVAMVHFSGPNADQPVTVGTEYEVSNFQQTPPVANQLEKSVGLADKDNNRIHDKLETKLNSINPSQPIEVIFVAKSPDLASDLSILGQLGIKPTKVWDKSSNLVHGGVVEMMPKQIETFARLASDNIAIIEENARAEFHSDVSTKITGIRPHIWDTLGYTGDINMSVAVLDSGIDDSHTAFGGGYTDGDFSSKIVGWHDVTGEYVTPTDPNGHGTHTSGIIGGDFIDSNNATSGRLVYTKSDLYESSQDNLLINRTLSNNIQNLGEISFDVSWEKIEVSGKAEAAIVRAVFLMAPDGTIVDSFRDNSGVTTSFSLNANIVSSSQFGNWSVIYEQETFADHAIAVSLLADIPYPDSTDSYKRFSGVAPNINIVGVKVAGSNQLPSASDVAAGLDWIRGAKETYNITIASISLGFDTVSPTLDTAIDALIDAGVLVIASAGNDGQTGANEVHSPGHVDRVITVGASDDNDQLSDYSSEGPGTSFSTVTKPDLVAPGGSISTGGIMSLDTNDGDGWGLVSKLVNNADNFIADQFPNDVTSMSGTSMSAALTAGVAALIIEAMGGVENWDYNSDFTVRKVKQLLLMTAHEIYSDSNGDKDRFEGFGRINPTAAIEAVTESYTIGSTAGGSLGTALTDDHAWARHMTLTGGNNYQFNLAVPSGTNLDLFVYASNSSSTGDPIIARSSQTTGNEELTFAPSKTGTYYVVVKTAYGASGSGSFSLTSTFLGVASDTSSPEIISPGNFLIPFGIPNWEANWTVIDENPDQYRIYQNGTLIAGPSSYNREISVNIDGLDLGIYNFTLWVNDTWGNEALDTAFGRVITDDIAPSITSLGDVTYPEFSTGNVIRWNAGDYFPNNYTVFVDGEETVSSQPWSNGTISASIDGYGQGTYNATLFVEDVFGNESNMTSYFTVIEPDTTDPTITSGGDITYLVNSTGNSIYWTVNDQFPGWYTIEKDGTEVVSARSWSAGQNITYNVDGLNVGAYSFTLTLADSSNNTVSSTIKVIVVSSFDESGFPTGAVVTTAIVVALAAAGTAAYIFKPEGVKGALGSARDGLGAFGGKIRDGSLSAWDTVKEKTSAVIDKVKDMANRDDVSDF